MTAGKETGTLICERGGCKTDIDECGKQRGSAGTLPIAATLELMMFFTFSDHLRCSGLRETRPFPSIHWFLDNAMPACLIWHDTPDARAEAQLFLSSHVTILLVVVFS